MTIAHYRSTSWRPVKNSSSISHFYLLRISVGCDKMFARPSSQQGFPLPPPVAVERWQCRAPLCFLLWTSHMLQVFISPSLCLCILHFSMLLFHIGDMEASLKNLWGLSFFKCGKIKSKVAETCWCLIEPQPRSSRTSWEGAECSAVAL